MLSVAVVQEASGLDPAANRARLPDLVPADSRPGRAARGLRPGLRRGRLRRQCVRRGAGRPVRDRGRPRSPRSTTRPSSPGMFETSADPARPFNTLVVRGAVERGVPQDPPLRLLRLPRVRRAARRARSRPWSVDVGRLRLGLMTCYDLRFPELARALVDRGAEVLVVPAAWVAGPRKVDHWRTLVRARAIENTVYVVAAAQPGPRYAGHSLVVDPLGDVLAEAGEGAAVLRATLTARSWTRPGGPTRRWPTAGCSTSAHLAATSARSTCLEPSPGAAPRAAAATDGGDAGRAGRAGRRSTRTAPSRRPRRLRGPVPRGGRPRSASRSCPARPWPSSGSRSAGRRAGTRGGLLVALWLPWSLAGLACLVAALVPVGPAWLDGVGAVAVVTAYTWGLAARTGGRPVVFGGAGPGARRRLCSLPTRTTCAPAPP